MHRVEHVMVRDVMVRDFPTVKHTDNVPQIIRVARANSRSSNHALSILIAER